VWGARGARWGVRHGRKCLRQVYGKLCTRELSPEVAEQSLKMCLVRCPRCAGGLELNL
jgi:hypothetical protein